MRKIVISILFTVLFATIILVSNRDTVEQRENKWGKIVTLDPRDPSDIAAGANFDGQAVSLALFQGSNNPVAFIVDPNNLDGFIEIDLPLTNITSLSEHIRMDSMGILYVSSTIEGGGLGLLKSGDGGKSWELIDVATDSIVGDTDIAIGVHFDRFVGPLMIGAFMPDLLEYRVLQSTDGGDSFSLLFTLGGV